MKKFISQEEIISIALIYEYTIYGDPFGNTLSKEKISKFTKALQKELDFINSSYEVDTSTIERDNLSFSTYPWIQEDRVNHTYKLCDFEKNKIRIWEWYQKLPIEITHVSLKEKVLQEIALVKKDFEIQKQYKEKSGNEVIYTLDGKRAREITREILEQMGCKNIQIFSATPVQTDDKAYKVSYQCDMAYECANILRRRNIFNPILKKAVKTIVVSDTALLGTGYHDTIEGIHYLKDLQDSGSKLIILSNRPEYCMRKIGGFTPNKENIYYQYLGPIKEKGTGIYVKLFTDFTTLGEIRLKADFTIFGNGIKVFNKDDKSIYEGSYIDSATLNRMIQNFKDYGYVPYGKQTSLKRDGLDDQGFQQGERVYKFFTPEIGTETISDRVYGMQCSGISSYYDDLIIEYIERENPTIKGYSLNLKPCFYQRDVNKLVAFENLLEETPEINIDHTVFILNEPTDDVLLEKYGDLSYCLGDSLREPKEDENTLVKILNKINH